MESCNPKSVKDIIEKDTPSVAVILKEPNGFEIVAAILVLLIEDLNQKSNIGKPMTGPQMNDTISLLIEKYPSAKIDDYVFAFKRIKTGEYGTFYGSIDGIVLGNMLKQYFDNKPEEVAAVNLAKSKKRIEESKEPIALPKGEINYPPVSEWFKPKQSEIKPSKPSKLSQQDLLLNSLMNQFDAIHKHRTIKKFYNCIGKFGKFIRRQGRMMNIDDFINHKAAQALLVREYIYQRRLNRLKPYLEFRKQRDQKRKSA